MFFKSINDIKNFIKENRLFKKENYTTIYIKTGDKSYSKYIETGHLLDIIYNNALILNYNKKDFLKLLPVINDKIKIDYARRKKQIQTDKALFEELQDVKKFIGYVMTDLGGNPRKITKGLYAIVDNEVLPMKTPDYDKLDYPHYNIVSVKNALMQDFENEYKEDYQAYLKQWREI